MSTGAISSEATSSFGTSLERINRPEPSRSEMSFKKARPCSSTFAMQSLQATTCIFSWLRIERSTKAPLSELSCSAVAGVERDSSANPHHDSGAVQERLGPIPTAGFFAQGEIGPVGGRNFLHGYTASVVIFSEPDSRKEHQ